MTLKMFGIHVLICVQLVGLGWMAGAQGVSSSIQGTVADRSGAAIPSAGVALTNTKPIADTLAALEQRLVHVRENLRTPGLREEFEQANRFRARR